MLVGLTAWKKDRNVQNLTTDQHQSNVQGITNPGLREAQAPPHQTSQPLKLGWESVSMHCSFGHHAVVIECYLFVAFCITDIIVQTI